MELRFEIHVLLQGAIIAQGFFAAGILFLSRVNRAANRFLGTLLLCFSLWLLDSFYREGGIYAQNPNYYFLPIFYSWAFGPFVYFYTLSLSNSRFTWKWSYLLHFFPAALQMGHYSWLSVQGYAFRRWYWLEVHRPYTYSLEFDGTFLSLMIYLIFSIRALNQYQKEIKEHYSEISRITLQWLKLVWGALLLLCLQWLVEIILRNYYDSYTEYNYSVTLMGMIVLLLAVGGILQQNIQHVPLTQKENKANNFPVDQGLLDQISIRMEKHQDYLHPGLSLSEFSRQLGHPPRLVSQHINHGLGLSFIDFVNQYRVDCIRKKIDRGETAQLTLLALALESGFNSKSSFNRIFKKFTGFTPREYLQKHS